ncbi:hypothetical protein EVAR_39175_1 [Eumeta japonica]|uniref:Uncharacterized protein n=1 Tax=Eumeta variegata TaxID=151549 RepID=A0A4C1VNL0_EUMVA|nr:hypothetical protein EVAR_39175_1 [Eumeta japonica]
MENCCADRVVRHKGSLQQFSPHGSTSGSSANRVSVRGPCERVFYAAACASRRGRSARSGAGGGRAEVARWSLGVVAVEPAIRSSKIIFAVCAGWRAAIGARACDARADFVAVWRRWLGCGWESLMKSVTLGNVTMSHRTRERPAECPSLSHSTMIGLPRAALEN